MLQINFYPDSDNKEFIEAAKEYQKIWQKEGVKIIETIERISRLTFKTKFITAVVFDGDQSYSYPLKLRYDYSYEKKKGVLIHELCHRLMLDNNIKTKKQQTLSLFTLKIHKRIFLILYDIWVELYGKKFAQDQVAREIKFTDSSYKGAWEWVLSFDELTRARAFKELLKNKEISYKQGYKSLCYL